MCAIFGALVSLDSKTEARRANVVMNEIIAASYARGRDGIGWRITSQPHNAYRQQTVDYRSTKRATVELTNHTIFSVPVYSGSVIGNLRAEPTTEFIREKSNMDQQPYRCGSWSIVHNGTIANDKELRTGEIKTSIDSAAIAELLASVDHEATTDIKKHFTACIRKLVGSFAILATNDKMPGVMFAACNYRPIWYASARNQLYFASAKNFFPAPLVPEMMESYSINMFNCEGDRTFLGSLSPVPVCRALVVCSGGMDSVVSAAIVKDQGYDVMLLHFTYGSRAEGPEVEAIAKIADALGVRYYIHQVSLYSPHHSPLLQADSKIAGGEEGAEFAHEWVPARNLVMLSLATAIAEMEGYDTIVLGNNLEEAGAYPDNEPEFINRFNDMLPFAVGSDKKVRVLMPVGNMMKHEIVAIGLKVDAPMHLTWSCYRAGKLHCGTCGPCFMRKTAFEINGQPEVIEYLN